ncbi:Nose resistant to fluoxetine protein 6 [Eumeta japonica]|uniref:Nose resistant to fluoxetine protein 6 n=1 Tax=Eumeta variegata TaxID=151549 RepID=A0A4C2A9G0_EUMVA|nr:Nose resistant to fluoxetine protein 6 [Eumeta japonica]
MPITVLVSTLVNRPIRISPAYWLIVGYAGTWWVRAGDGPLWTPLVEREADACTHKWWAQLLYLNNVVRTDEHCLIQTWYLAADMQLYVLGAVLTIALARWGRGRALEALAALWAVVAAAQLAAAYAWRLQPNLVVHRPEAVHAQYVGDPTFARLYQSPLGNAPSALAGLLVAHAHYRIIDAGVHFHEHKVWAWVTRVSGPLAVAWVMLSPLLVGGGPPARLPAAALAAFERPVFGIFVAFGLLGAIQNIRNVFPRAGDWLSWSGWRAGTAVLSAAAAHVGGQDVGGGPAAAPEISRPSSVEAGVTAPFRCGVVAWSSRKCDSFGATSPNHRRQLAFKTMTNRDRSLL